MAMVFIVDYWLPFPSSEYGGIQVVVADGPEECVQYIIAEMNDYERKRWPKAEDLIQVAVANATLLRTDALVRGIVKQFTT